jgi:Protein of unknown function (DUF2946)
MNRRRTGIAAYVAILAIALQALWPLLAQAKPQSAVLVPVCTVDGVTHYLELPAGKAPAEQSSVHHEHCAFCSFGGERLALPSFANGIACSDSPAEKLPDAAVRASKAEKPSFARPRAPPVIS